MDKTSILLRLPKKLKIKIEKIAKHKGLTTTGLILTVLDEYQRQEGGNQDDK